MFSATVYNIMIGAPSDIKEEIEIAKEVIFRWDMTNSHLHHCVLLPLHWSNSTYPTAGEHPQKSIDKQMVEKSDLMVCIFCSRLGSPTDTHISGSVEEIEEHQKAGKTVMTFFKKNMVSPQNDKDIEQLQKLMEYKKSIRDSVYWGEYESVNDFEKIFREKLELYLNDNWLTGLSDIEDHHNEFKLSEFDKKRLATWVNSKEPRFIRKGPSGRKYLFVLGDKNFFYASEGAEYAEWEDFFERMVKLGLIEIDASHSKREPFYKLKHSAYEYVKGLDDTISNDPK